MIHILSEAQKMHRAAIGMKKYRPTWRQKENDEISRQYFINVRNALEGYRQTGHEHIATARYLEICDLAGQISASSREVMNLQWKAADIRAALAALEQREREFSLATLQATRGIKATP